MKAFYNVKLSDGSESIMVLDAKRDESGKILVFNGKWYIAEGSLKPDSISEQDGFSTWDSFSGRTVYHEFK